VGPGLKPCTRVIQVLPTVLSKLTLVEGVHPKETPVLDLLNEQMISGTVTDSTAPGWLVILPPVIGVNQTSHKESLGLGLP
jgi:hypothetical protein